MTSPGSSQRRFILRAAFRDLSDFRAFAVEAARLKSYGEVLVNVGVLADKAWHEIPEGGSAWHEYAVYNPALHKVFPHPKIAPHVPADYVKANRELVLDETAILRELGLGAWFMGQEPYFLPESFFREHPHLRGPRIDHPRRSRREEFAMCMDLDESREMVAWMMCELKKQVPELAMFMFNTNDAGSGFCWAAAQYSGPNGPRHCRSKTAGQRVRAFTELLHEGARTGGGDVSIFLGHANFWRGEREDVLANLPPDTALLGHDEETVGIGSHIGGGYPVLGLVSPLGIIRGMERVAETDVRNVFVGVGATYHRSVEETRTVEKVLDIVIDCLERPVSGLRARLDRLHELSVHWAGEKKAEAVTEALHDLDLALHAKQMLVPAFRPIYCAVSVRHLTRPLVFDPRLLTPEEEQYFLPHVFNISPSEARNDYIDLHGSRMTVGTGDVHGIPALLGVLDRMRGAAATLEDAKDGPEGEWLFRLATSVRIHVHVIRSIYNFYFGQKIRDRHAAELAREEPVVPEKVGSWDGEGEILAWNERMRDELDNVSELTRLLEERGLDQIARAPDERHEDTFVLGPDVLDHLKKKVRVMRDHWLDVERYLAPPHK